MSAALLAARSAVVEARDTMHEAAILAAEARALHGVDSPAEREAWEVYSRARDDHERRQADLICKRAAALDVRVVSMPSERAS